MEDEAFSSLRIKPLGSEQMTGRLLHSHIDRPSCAAILRLRTSRLRNATNYSHLALDWSCLRCWRCIMQCPTKPTRKPQQKSDYKPPHRPIGMWRNFSAPNLSSPTCNKSFQDFRREDVIGVVSLIGTMLYEI